MEDPRWMVRHELQQAFATFREELRTNLLPAATAILVTRGAVKTVSTADSGRKLLVDEVTSYTSGVSGTGLTEVGRLEPAGFLIVPRPDGPSVAFGNLRNAVYLPISGAKYRPTGGKLGDQAIYSLSDTRATLWNRASGDGEWESSGAAKIKLGANGSAHIESAGGATIDLSELEPRVRVNETLHADHYAGGDLIPVAVPGPALGGGPVLVTGTDAAMTVTMTVAPMAPPGVLCIITFGKPYDGEPHLGGPFPKTPTMALPPPAGLSGAIFATAVPTAVTLACAVNPPPGLYRFSLTVVG